MLYQVKITSFANDIAKRLSSEIKKAAKAAFKELAENPYLGKELQTELSGFWSYRFLRYRIVYKVDRQEKTIIVWAIGHRRDIYDTMNEHVRNFSAEEPKHRG